MIEMKPPPLHWQVRAAQKMADRWAAEARGKAPVEEALWSLLKAWVFLLNRPRVWVAGGLCSGLSDSISIKMYQRCWVSWDKALLKVLRPCRLNTDFKNVTDLRNTKDFFPKPYTYIHVLPTSALYLLSFSMLLVGVGLKASVRASLP